MADMAAALGEAGGCPVVEANGTAWKIGHPVQAAKKFLEDLILDGVETDLLAGKARNPAAFAAAWESHMADRRRRRYATLTGDLWMEQALDPQRGPVLLLASLLRCHHPGATEDDALALLAAEPERVQAAMARVLPDFFETLLAGPAAAALPPAAREQVRAGLRAAAAEMLTAASRPAPTPSPSPA